MVGDRCVGKTSLLLTYSQNKFPEGTAPTVIDAYTGMTTHKGDDVRLEVYDTAGQDDFARVRPISYNNSSVFIVCFSLINEDSLENACTKWFKEVKQLGPKCPLILVGTKSDMRDEFLNSGTPSKQKMAITYTQGLSMAKKHNFSAYYECSAKN